MLESRNISKTSPHNRRHVLKYLSIIVPNRTQAEQKWVSILCVTAVEMSGCSKTLLCASLSSPFKFKCTPPPPTLSLSLSSLLRRHNRATWRCYTSAQSAASSIEVEEPQSRDTVSMQHLLTCADSEGVSALMKMERKPLLLPEPQARWFPYLDRFRCGNGCVISSADIIDAVSPCISDTRKQRFGNAVRNRSYSVCLVVEGLCDFGNVSAAFRSADALGVQSVHVVSSDANKRC